MSQVGISLLLDWIVGLRTNAQKIHSQSIVNDHNCPLTVNKKCGRIQLVYDRSTERRGSGRTRVMTDHRASSIKILFSISFQCSTWCERYLLCLCWRRSPWLSDGWRCPIRAPAPTAFVTRPTEMRAASLTRTSSVGNISRPGAWRSTGWTRETSAEDTAWMPSHSRHRKKTNSSSRDLRAEMFDSSGPRAENATSLGAIDQVRLIFHWNNKVKLNSFNRLAATERERLVLVRIGS